MRGISSFISAVLLIGIAVTIAVITLSWYTGLIKLQSASVSNQTSTQIQCEWGGIRILTDTIKCNFSGTTDYLNFSLENSGSIPLYDFKAQINVNGVVYTYAVYEAGTNASFTSSYPLKPNEVKTVWVNITDDLTGDIDWLRVVTQCPGVTTGRISNVDCTP